MTTSRMELLGTLVCESAIHVGGWSQGASQNDSSDGKSNTLVTATDASGRLIIPGTSLTGVLRANPELAHLEPLWGSSREDGHASLISVDDAVITSSAGDGHPDSRTQVSISRYSGAAVDQMLFDREVVPAGSEFTLLIRINAGADHTAAHESAGDDCSCPACALASVLTNGIQVGAGSGRGLGAVRLTDATVSVMTWDRPGLTALLKGTLPSSTPYRAAVTHSGSRGAIAISWRALGPVMSKSNDAQGVAVPRSVQRGDRVHLLIPGSSLRGAFRSQAERIMATAFGGPVAATDSTGAAGQLDFLERSASAPFPAGSGQLGPVGLLFGSAAASMNRNERRSALGWRGVLRFDDLISERSVPEADWKILIDEARKPGSQRKPNELDSSLRFTSRVAIDRWTGGASEGRLHVALEPYWVKEGDWAPITLSVDLRRLNVASDTLANAALGLLWLTIEDLRKGRFGIGFGYSRGYGDVDVTSVSASGMNDEWPHNRPEEWIEALMEIEHQAHEGAAS